MLNTRGQDPLSTPSKRYALRMLFCQLCQIFLRRKRIRILPINTWLRDVASLFEDAIWHPPRLCSDGIHGPDDAAVLEFVHDGACPGLPAYEVVVVVGHIIT